MGGVFPANPGSECVNESQNSFVVPKSDTLYTTRWTSGDNIHTRHVHLCSNRVARIAYRLRAVSYESYLTPNDIPPVAFLLGSLFIAHPAKCSTRLRATVLARACSRERHRHHRHGKRSRGPLKGRSSWRVQPTGWPARASRRRRVAHVPDGSPRYVPHEWAHCTWAQFDESFVRRTANPPVSQGAPSPWGTSLLQGPPSERR